MVGSLHFFSVFVSCFSFLGPFLYFSLLLFLFVCLPFFLFVSFGSSRFILFKVCVKCSSRFFSLQISDVSRM